MPKTKIKPKSKKPSSQWEIVEDFKLIPMAQDGKKLTYQWSNQQPPSNYTLATPKDVNVSRTESNRKLTQKEIDQLAKYTAEQNQLKKEQEYNQRKQAIQQSIEAQNQPLTIDNLRTQTQAIGDKMSFAMSRFGNPKEYPTLSGYMDALDYINPGKFIGDMATGLGALPYNVREGNYGQAALSLAVPLATGAIGSFGQKPAGSLFREQVYKAVDPVAYGMKEKLKLAPKTWLKNTISSDESKRALEIGKQLSNLNPEYFADDITRIGQNRLDAFRVGLKLPQKYDTFEQIAENTYRIKNMNPQVGEFSSVYNDLIANDYLKNATGVYSGENPLVTIARKHDKLTSPTIKTEFGDYSVNDLRRYLMKEKDELPAWEQHRIVEKAKNPKFTHSVYDADRQGIMGSFRWDIKKPNFENDYKLHFQSNDLWNLNPFEKRGAISIKPKEDLSKFHFKPFENFEALSFVGGKPFNIQNNFVLDPKTYKILEKYKSGGKIKTDPKGYWNKDNHGKPVRIPSNQITMKGVNQPLMGISDTGDIQYMQPNGEYLFDGNSVLEFPIMQQGGKVRQPIKGTKEQYQAYQDSLDLYNKGEKDFYNTKNLFKNKEINFNENKHFWEIPIKTYTETYNNVNSGEINGIYPQSLTNFWNYQNIPEHKSIYRFKKPVQPIIYEPKKKKVNDSQLIFDGNRYRKVITDGYGSRYADETLGNIQSSKPDLLQSINSSPQRSYWNSIFQGRTDKDGVTNITQEELDKIGKQPINNSKIAYKRYYNIVDKQGNTLSQGHEVPVYESELQGDNQQLEFNPIPFKKGTYFTRERQNQEADSKQFGRKGKKDYFDKKTGKLLGTYKNGGKVSDWEIIFD